MYFFTAKDRSDRENSSIICTSTYGYYRGKLHFDHLQGQGRIIQEVNCQIPSQLSTQKSKQAQ